MHYEIKSSFKLCSLQKRSLDPLRGVQDGLTVFTSFKVRVKVKIIEHILPPRCLSEVEKRGGNPLHFLAQRIS